ncbi:RNA polymerase sigma factor [Crocinitomix catalasitica]|uniref:RNA polymerase sigma factor n=1 Tax=Crocinitomix catalasitica TaxID=184607 RepID=UPI0005636BB2|nr:sigma-70 family RNA polymerase sigma factor [Crocinitomix catalasitica]
MTISDEVIDLIKKKDRKIELDLYRSCFGIMMSTTNRYYINKEDSKLVINTAFLKVLNNKDKYKKNNPFKAWVKRIVLNEIIDEYRRTKKHKSIFIHTENQSSESITLNSAEFKLEADYLDFVLKSLPPGTRTVFNLFAIDGYSHKEIGEKMKISIETSKWHVKEARKRLKILLKK